jgi:CRP-like cAMP-binding protein
MKASAGYLEKPTFVHEALVTSSSLGRKAGAKTLAPPSSRSLPFDLEAFLAKSGVGRTFIDLQKQRIIFSQGDPADSVFYLKKGRIKLTVMSARGKEATIALLAAKDFLGEECLAPMQPRHLASAATLTQSSLLRIDRNELVRVLREEQTFSEMFVAFLVARNVRIQEDLIDQLFNSSEKRLARTLLLLAQFGKEGEPETIIPKISQELLAEMIGTTRSRVSFFMNRFRKLGFIEYNGQIKVHRSLLNFILHD